MTTVLLKTSLARLYSKNLNFKQKLTTHFLVINGVLYFFSSCSQNELGVIPGMQLTHTVILR